MAKIAILIVAAAVFVIGILAPFTSLTSIARQATPASPPPIIASEVFGRAAPAVVENPELALGRVTIMPGVAIPVHYHAGTQIGVVVQGELTYEVFSGEIAWYRGEASSGVPAAIQPGETVVVRTGDTLIEPPGSIHQGRNEGDVPIVIYLSTLFPSGAPRSITVDATPVP